MSVYAPPAVPPGSAKLAVAAPFVTVPETTGVPMVVAPCVTVKVTVPSLTGTTDETVALRVTFCAVVLKGAVAFVTAVVVAAAAIVSVPPVLVLVRKFGLVAAGL